MNSNIIQLAVKAVTFIQMLHKVGNKQHFFVPIKLSELHAHFGDAYFINIFFYF